MKLSKKEKNRVLHDLRRIAGALELLKQEIDKLAEDIVNSEEVK